MLPLLLLLSCFPKHASQSEEGSDFAFLTLGPLAPRVCLPQVQGAGKVKVGKGLLAQAHAALAAGDLASAEAALANAEAEGADHVAFSATRGVLALARGRLDEATGLLRDAANEWREDACLQEAAAVGYYALRQYTFATALSGEARRMAPEEPDFLYLDALLLSRANNQQESRGALRSTLALRPDHPGANALLGGIYLQEGSADQALPLLRRAVAGGVDLRKELAQALFETGGIGEYLSLASGLGYPLGDEGQLASAPDPEAAFRTLLGVKEGEQLEVEFHTTMGDVSCELFWREAPVTVGNFVGLARGTQPWVDPNTGEAGSGPYYDGVIFHRVIPSFMVQTGDRKGTGTGDPGYRFVDEIRSERHFDRPGLLAMANAGPGTNGSQFFITEVPVAHLNGRHTIFGQCDDASVAVIKAIARVPTGAQDLPMEPVVIETVRVSARPSAN